MHKNVIIILTLFYLWNCVFSKKICNLLRWSSHWGIILAKGQLATIHYDSAPRPQRPILPTLIYRPILINQQRRKRSSWFFESHSVITWLRLCIILAYTKLDVACGTDNQRTKHFVCFWKSAELDYVKKRKIELSKWIF